MKKKLFSIIMCVLMVMCFMPTLAFATSVDTSTTTETSCTHEAAIGNVHYDTLAEAVTVASDNDTITLLNDVATTSNINITKAVTLDLNGRTITANSVNASNKAAPAFTIKEGGKLDVKGTGKIKIIQEYAAFYVKGNATDDSSKTVNLVIGKDVTVEGGAFTVFVERYDKNNNVSYNVDVDIYGTLIGYETIYVSGNIKGTSGNVPEITLHSGAKIQDTTGLYLAGYAKTTIEDNVSIEVVEGEDAENTISIAAGELTINGGTFKTEASLGNVQGEGGAIDEETCCALSIKQHETNLPVIVKVNGGTFEAAIPFNQQTGEKGASAAPDKVQLSITGGTFTSTSSASGATSIKSADKTGFITGGTFSSNPTEYVADGFIAKKNSDTEYVVIEKANLGTGTYMANPDGSLAGSRYWAVDNNDGTWTVYYSAPSSSSSSSTTKTDSVTNTTETTKTESGATEAKAETKATVSAETKTAADGTKTTTATVDTTTASKIVEKAVENKSEEVVVTAAATPVAETAAGTTTEVAIPAETVSQIAEKTTAAVTIESEAAKVTLDQEAVAAVAETAGEAGTVSLVVETKAQDENKVEVDLKIETSNGTVSDFKGGTVSVTVKLNSALAAKPVMCVYIDDNGVYHKVAGQKNADGTYTFQTGHFSTYAIMPEDQANDVIAQQDNKAAELTKALKLKASSTKTKKGNVKVTLKVDDEKIQDIEALGYTVKYKFYRSTKKASSYKAKFETSGKTYTNTTGKKGTRYYYKARVMVYDSDGTLIAKSALTKCRYATRMR